MHSYISGLLGGSLIGGSAAGLLLSAGEILGASGIVSSVLLAPIKALRDPSQHWKLVLISSFTLPAYLFFAPPKAYADKDQGLASLSPLAFAIGGLLVGFGTKLGNGCTSGHGICGMARLSKRSFAAVGTFMTTGIVTAYLTQAATTPFSEHALQFLRNSSREGDAIEYFDTAAAVIVMVLALAALSAPTFHRYDDTDSSSDSNRNNRNNMARKVGPAAAAGFLFSTGLYVSQMVYPSVVFGFLNLGLIPQGTWNPTLVFVMGSGVVVSFLSYQFVEPFRVLKLGRRCQPLSHPVALDSGSDFSVPTNRVIDTELVLGAACFGLGWGTTGLCPGPAMFLASVGVSPVLVYYWPTFLVGSYLATKVKNRAAQRRNNQSSPETTTTTTNDANKTKDDDGHADLKKPLVTSYGSTEKKR